MTQEDKELLLRDLSARLPYNVQILADIDKDFEGGCVATLAQIGPYNGIIRFYQSTGLYPYTIEEIRPYLFPLSSLTEEQRNDISKLLIDTQNTFSPYGEINPKGCDNLFVCSVKQSNTFINYCLMHHLDINGLIEKGLAIDAIGLNIY